MSKAFFQEDAPAISKRERRKQAFREKIIAAAIEQFEEKGCDATTLEDICAVADISRPTFYSYYPSKQDLINAMAEMLWLNVVTELTTESLAKHESTKQFVESFFKLIRQEFNKYSKLEGELIRQSMNSDPSESNNINILEGITQLFETVYAEGRKRGDIGNRFPIDFLAEMTMGAISSVMMKWAVNQEYPIDKRLKQLATYIQSMLELEK